MDIINLIHLLIIGPLFIYLGWMKERLNPNWYAFLFALGVMTMIYHGYKLYLHNSNRPVDITEMMKIKNI